MMKMLVIFLGSCCVFGFIINLIVVLPVIKLAITSTKSPVYIIASVNIITDNFNILLIAISLILGLLNDVKQ
ncbi:unnamed protein product [Caenorhabditis angaria]|uniref:7TM GPCR serpentine receptor class x (Srx) domain-containing protein n=1 Tax=Caenorhabditis angaria TaxID=860376 RepID=A0A9P1IW44_9PELO|nr:unnamed protein product [Caenorhabditis angaria]